ncbi:2-oxoacid:acceptor oxidoreductase family protein [Chitinispirillales bacterium ANBcel5]|uniref:2-oxoacid:acceptor oxidoreductase family protein n=1 Tax=Cellulosispirillum alkaliphilum TaxID=3039283 RepID=UPI002A51B7D9|nr:2-oxoacid:acceptor oxidoreductase family protein [Chitinispirillales bacterium ANBcel5]
MNLDIRMAGLGGQGVVTAAHILGTAVVNSGKHASVNPFFGAEKRLAPAESYVRISQEPIYDRGEVLFPNFIMIYAPEVITMGKSYTMPFYSGLKKNGLVLINSDKEILSDKEMDGLKSIEANIYYVPATKLAIDFAGTAMAANMTMLGALCGLVELVDLDAVMDAVEERFSGKTKMVASGTTAVLDEALKSKYEKVSQMIEKNRQAIVNAFQYVKKEM